jgi:hypothetical protein
MLTRRHFGRQSQRGICAILLGEDPDALLIDLQKQFPGSNGAGCNGEQFGGPGGGLYRGLRWA